MGFKIKDMTRKSSSVEPVQFISSKERFLLFVEENRGLVWGVIFLVVAVFISVFTLNYLSKQKVEKAWELHGEAQRIYVDRPLDDIEKGKANIKKSSELFEKLLTQYPETTPARVSSFLMANGLMDLEDYEGAIRVYTSLTKELERDPMMLALVYQRLGLAYLLNGNREAAIEAFDQVLNNGQAMNKDQVIFELAKLAEADEQTDKAVEHYKRLMQEFPVSPFSSEAALRVKVLAPEEPEETVDRTSPLKEEALGESEGQAKEAEN